MKMALQKQWFKIQQFTNPRTGSISWRVTGTKRDGTRICENFSREHDAKCRHIDLEAKYLTRQTETKLRSTSLTDVQIKLAELVFKRFEDDADITRAVDYWFVSSRIIVAGD